MSFCASSLQQGAGSPCKASVYGQGMCYAGVCANHDRQCRESGKSFRLVEREKEARGSIDNKWARVCMCVCGCEGSVFAVSSVSTYLVFLECMEKACTQQGGD